jgi:NAD(P)-dependent dehydrogenase (short-subunit alcohol dehydrogenase family)
VEVFPRGAVVVSGASGGLGKAVARLLAARGAPLALIDRRSPDDVANELASDGTECVALAADLRDADHLEDAVARADVALDAPVRHLVHCAAVLRMAPVADLAPDEFRDVLDVNVVGAFVLARAVAERAAVAGGGAVVLVSSTGGLVSGAASLAYGASKHAVHGVVQGMAVEYGRRGVRVNAVCPGTMDTPLFGREVADDWARRFEGRSAAGKLEADRAESLVARLPEPEHVAEVCALLLSPAGQAVSGQAHVLWGSPLGAA